MTPRPARPKIYHITHVDNLAAIVSEGRLHCDRAMLERGGPKASIGMSGIKRRRVEKIDVTVNPGTKVGDYVPFYFCPRSVMLFVIKCANHDELGYRGGQDPIVHLEADLDAVIEWANARDRHWAFSLSNAGAYVCEFRKRGKELDELDWEAISANDFRDPEVKEGKQAEFLVHEYFPFELVEVIGVKSDAVAAAARLAIEKCDRPPKVKIRPDWYF